MRILRAGFLVRRMRSAWLLLTCLMASVLITSVLISAMISFYSTALPAAVRKKPRRLRPDVGSSQRRNRHRTGGG